MALFLLLIGCHELLALGRGQRVGQVARTVTLGTGLVLAGLAYHWSDRTYLSTGLEWTATSLLIVAIYLCYRDGTLARTFLCRRERRKSGRRAAL